MSLNESIAALRKANQSVPKPARLPTEIEIANAEEKIGIRFHPDFRIFLLQASDVVIGTLEPITITLPESHTDLIEVTRSAREWGVPNDWIPVCESNDDYFCITPRGDIRFWSHDSASNERWPSLSEWIDSVWLQS